MEATAQQLWNDEAGFIVSLELILIATIVVIGLMAGLTALRGALVSEMSDVAGAVQDMNQSYSYTGVASPSANTGGSSYADTRDTADEPEDPYAQADNGIVFDVPPIDEL